MQLLINTLYFYRSKRSRFGIKIFFNCPAAKEWQGYSWAFEIFYGKDSNLEVPEVGTV